MVRLVLKVDRQGCAILAAMRNFEQDGLLADVTLTTGVHETRFHQAILSHFSPFFRRIFQRVSVPHPVLSLAVPYEDLQLLVELMFQGSAPVEVAQLHSVMRSADTLRIRGIRIVSEADLTVTPAARIYDSDQQPGPSGLGRNQQPGPSGLGRNRRVRFASPAAERLVSMMHAARLTDNAPQAAPERMETQSNAVQIAIPDSTGDGVKPTSEDDEEEHEQMDIDMPDSTNQPDPLE